VFGEISGLIVQEFTAITTRPIDFIIVGTLLVFAAFAIWLLADDLQQSLRRARENENKLVQSNLELENAPELSFPGQVAIDRKCSRHYHVHYRRWYHRFLKPT
jgi:hypothetical protein